MSLDINYRSILINIRKKDAETWDVIETLELNSPPTSFFTWTWCLLSLLPLRPLRQTFSASVALSRHPFGEKGTFKERTGVVRPDSAVTHICVKHARLLKHKKYSAFAALVISRIS